MATTEERLQKWSNFIGAKLILFFKGKHAALLGGIDFAERTYVECLCAECMRFPLVLTNTESSRLYNLIDWVIHADVSFDVLSDEDLQQVILEQVAVQLPDQLQPPGMAGPCMQLRECMMQLGEQAGAEKRVGKTVWLMNFFRDPGKAWMQGEVVSYDRTCGVHLIRLNNKEKRVHFALHFLHMSPTLPDDPEDPPYLPRFTTLKPATLPVPADAAASAAATTPVKHEPDTEPAASRLPQPHAAPAPSTTPTNHAHAGAATTAPGHVYSMPAAASLSPSSSAQLAGTAGSAAAGLAGPAPGPAGAQDVCSVAPAAPAVPLPAVEGPPPVLEALNLSWDESMQGWRMWEGLHKVFQWLRLTRIEQTAVHNAMLTLDLATKQELYAGLARECQPPGNAEAVRAKVQHIITRAYAKLVSQQQGLGAGMPASSTASGMAGVAGGVVS